MVIDPYIATTELQLHLTTTIMCTQYIPLLQYRALCHSNLDIKIVQLSLLDFVGLIINHNLDQTITVLVLLRLSVADMCIIYRIF